MNSVKGNIVDIEAKNIYCGEVVFDDGRIVALIENGLEDTSLPYITPGFTDSHIHIESSMLTPVEFARLAVVHGTVATVSDPHEIANVCGVAGVEYMLENAALSPFKFHSGAPSCVPATKFETAGAELNSDDVETLLKRDDIFYLSEMMNFPGVLNKDPEVMKKIKASHLLGKPVDGHAPDLRGDEARKYIAAGISTDHECFTEEEAGEKLASGMKILIREGSAAKNFEALINLLHDHEDDMMFCSDDKHPDSLVDGHINELCRRAVEKGIDKFKVLKAACINPVKHYKLRSGTLKPGGAADFILLSDLENFTVLETYIDGNKVAEKGRSLLPSIPFPAINKFDTNPKKPEDFRIKAGNNFPAIAVLDGQLITEKVATEPMSVNGLAESNIDTDTIKVVVINRYQNTPPAVAFIKNTGLKSGALASSVAHDSHNIVAIGADDQSLCRAVNLVIENKGGIAAVSGNDEKVLPLPVAGLMSDADGYAVAEAYTCIDRFAKEKCGSTLSAPFMSLSFMALLVIPKIKLSDKGLFDAESFRFYGA